MKLYWSPPMTSLAILILCHEADFPVELVKMDLDTRHMPDGRVLSDINPKNCMPVLERDDGAILTETAVILDWLAAQDPDLRLTAPAHSDEHLRIMEWMVYFATEQHKLATLLFWEIDDRAKREARKRVIDRFGLTEKALEASDYLVDHRFTIADIYLFVMVQGCVHLFDGFHPGERFPLLLAHSERVGERPAVRRAREIHR